ncbi:hypothetical protein [Actinoplanes xinjiangensis]|uniref:hypothetical protein n=1 Tax=Actinoplanes xinjiangensis TaxID=512350 RepID=UPI0034268974
MSGVIVASTLLLLPATATAAVGALIHPTTVVTAGSASSTAGPVDGKRIDGTVRRAAAGGTGGTKSAVAAANVPFRLSVPGAVASGAYGSTQGRPGTPQVTVSLKVTGRAPCGVLQLTRNGPADGIEWYTVGALCHSGTATFRTQVNRLWGSRALPSVRLCNGDGLGLAEGVDCDDFVPRRGA